MAARAGNGRQVAHAANRALKQRIEHDAFFDVSRFAHQRQPDRNANAKTITPIVTLVFAMNAAAPMINIAGRAIKPLTK